MSSNVYYFGNILYHVWNEFWGSHGQLAIMQHGVVDYELIREPGRITIAIADRDSLESLRMYLDSYTPNIVEELQNIRSERDDVAIYFHNFAKTIYRVIRDIKWNTPLKGKCGWERGFWSIT
jgi:hypothetical protein